MSNKKSWCPFLQRDCEDKCINHYLIPIRARIATTEYVIYEGTGHCKFFDVRTKHSGAMNMTNYEENDKEKIGKIRELTDEEKTRFNIYKSKKF